LRYPRDADIEETACDQPYDGDYYNVYGIASPFLDREEMRSFLHG
jgi:hypothetical protein